jgi:trk system potassium uptake protein TrkH
MSFKRIFRSIGALLFAFGLSMLFPLIWALYFKDGDAIPILISLLITSGIGLILWKFIRTEEELRPRDSFALVTFAWIILAGFASLPYLLAGTFHSFTNAYFEAMSGLTAAGASVIPDIEVIPRGILFWRSQTQWIGGMGIILLSIAILPMVGAAGMELFKAEVPGPTTEKLRPRIRETAKALWIVYVLLTGIEVILLYVGDMSLYEAMCHAFSTMSTGGFSPKNQNIGAYGNLYFEIVIMVFMFLGAVNFALHYRMLRGDIKSYFRDREFLFYCGIIGAVVLFIILVESVFTYHNGLQSIRKCLFPIVSTATTTGFTTTDYNQWTNFSQYALLFLMFVGGCAGSTAGGIKIVRLFLLLRYGASQLVRTIHPKAVISVKLADKGVPPEIMTNILGFFFLYIAVFFVGSIILTVVGLDIKSAFGAVAASMATVGPGLGSVGPMQNYANVHAIGKWTLDACMLVGRLEIYTVLVLFVPGFWRKW